MALGAVASSVLAALIAAGVTSLTTTYLVQRSEDRRLSDAAGVLAGELDEFDNASVADLVSDEYRETRHTGIKFAVFRGPNGKHLAGDTDIESVEGCRLSGSIRACGVKSGRGFQVVAAASYTPVSLFLALSSLVAALVAAAGAWLAARPVSLLLMGPLSDLRERVDSIDLAAGGPLPLGPPVGIVEIDALRDTIGLLLTRIAEAVCHAERFAADAAHELRTPLTTIRGELELLAEDSALPASAVSDLARASRKVVDLQTLVERLLVLALPDQSGWSASELTSVHDLAEDVIAAQPPSQRERIELSAARGDVVVRGDAALLGMMFSNALCNGLKFARRVKVSAAEDGADVVVRVDDDGPGVPLEERLLVFEPFIRSPTARKPQIPGHGLGLALIAHVARRHGGSVRFMDEAPGAHLEIRLPRSATRRVEPYKADGIRPPGPKS